MQIFKQCALNLKSALDSTIHGTGVGGNVLEVKWPKPQGIPWVPPSLPVLEGLGFRV